MGYHPTVTDIVYFIGDSVKDCVASILLDCIYNQAIGVVCITDMPRFTMEICAELDGIGSITTPQDYPWYILLRCGNCGERTEKPAVIRDSDEVEGIRGAKVSLKITCKLCGRVNDVKILPGKCSYTSDISPEWGPFLHLECRGTEPLEVQLADDEPLKVLGHEGFEFEEAFIEDGEFYSYDEKLNTEASITEYRSRIVKG